MVTTDTSAGTILVVDDNPANIDVLFRLLDQAGFQVRVAQGGASAIAKVSYEIPDLILLDVVMPDLDGFSTCARLKADPATAEIPIIFMSALDESLDKLRGLKLGAVDYITKPFNHDEVIARVNLHWQLHYLNKRLRQEVHDRRSAEQALQKLNLELEERVVEKTDALKRTMAELEKTYSQLLEREKQLEHDVCHDALTGLPNRVWLMRRLDELVKLAHQGHASYAVLFIDLDRFKVINDSLGHLVGDQLLKSVSRRIQNSLGDKNTAIRLGGDEFIILMEGTDDVEAAINLAEVLQAQLNRGFRLNQYQLKTGASIGITTSQYGYRQPEEVLRDADIAMYYAKAKGRGCYQVLTKQIQAQAIARWQLEVDLRQGIEFQEFYLHYQPIISLETCQLAGFEALLRWSHPNRGIVNPSEFIHVSEETGLIHQLGWWALQSSIQQLQIWQNYIPRNQALLMSVNISPVQLDQPNLPDRLATLLEKTSISWDHLKLEITEGCLLETTESRLATLQRLRDLGIKLLIDDFGVGYSSLSRLHELPVDTLKIDRSFVSRLGNENNSQPIVQTIITLAQSLGMSVVAEGIESTEQRDILRKLGCELGQGFLFAKPLDVRTATQRVKEMSVNYFAS